MFEVPLQVQNILRCISNFGRHLQHCHVALGHDGDGSPQVSTPSHPGKKNTKRSKNNATSSSDTPSPPPSPPVAKGSTKESSTPKKSSTGDNSKPQSRTKTDGRSPAKSADDIMTEQDTEGRLVDIEEF